jgi:large subunit ribosomal protein L4
MRAFVRNMAGETVSEVELNDEIFGVEPNEGVMHQAMLRQMANSRLGTAQTKTRGEVSGGGRKPWRQKHTGRARQGSIRAPHWKGGGVVFGPHPRSYAQQMPQKMRRLALRSAFSVKAGGNQLILLDELTLAVPKTRDMLSVLGNLQADLTTLILLPERNVNVELSTRNLPGVKTVQAQSVSIVDLLRHDTVVLPMQALGVIEKILG